MFTVYEFKFYRFFKSGLLLDFFVKRITFYVLAFLLKTYSIFFSEKYFVEYNFQQITKWLRYVSFFVDYLNNEATFAVLSVAALAFFVTLLFILMFEFTQFSFWQLLQYYFF